MGVKRAFVCRVYGGGQREASMPTTHDKKLLESLLEALLDLWDRNNTHSVVEE
jgi:hypothetical protein